MHGQKSTYCWISSSYCSSQAHSKLRKKPFNELGENSFFTKRSVHNKNAVRFVRSLAQYVHCVTGLVNVSVFITGARSYGMLSNYVSTPSMKIMIFFVTHAQCQYPRRFHLQISISCGKSFCPEIRRLTKENDTAMGLAAYIHIPWEIALAHQRKYYSGEPIWLDFREMCAMDRRKFQIVMAKFVCQSLQEAGDKSKKIAAWVNVERENASCETR